MFERMIEMRGSAFPSPRLINRMMHSSTLRKADERTEGKRFISSILEASSTVVLKEGREREFAACVSVH